MVENRKFSYATCI